MNDINVSVMFYILSDFTGRRNRAIVAVKKISGKRFTNYPTHMRMGTMTKDMEGGHAGAI